VPGRSRADIRALGVARLALFGSVLRNEALPDSDVDLLVQFSPGRKSYERFLALSDLLEARLSRRVEVLASSSPPAPRTETAVALRRFASIRATLETSRSMAFVQPCALWLAGTDL
jgi:predicted nucleotidyltransferase